MVTRKDSDWEHDLLISPVAGKSDTDALRESIKRQFSGSDKPRYSRKTWTRMVSVVASGLLVAGIIGAVIFHGSTSVNGHTGQNMSSQNNSFVGSLIGQLDEGLAIFGHTQFYSDTGYPLYTVLVSTSGGVSEHQIAAHATWARFSSDGEWIAVAQPDSQRFGEPQTTSLWMMRNDGTDKVKVPNSNFAFGAWIPHTHKFVYGSTGGGALLMVEPGGQPKPFAVNAPQVSAVHGVEFSPDGRHAAILVSVSGTPRGPYDVLLIEDLSSRSQRTLIQTNAPDGIILGPWSTDGQSIFWWSDPQHSESDDGQTLMQTDLSGHSRLITTTLVDTVLQAPQFIHETVNPFGAGDAVLEVGGGREVFMNKTVGLYEAGQVKTVPKEAGKVQLSPSVSNDGKHVAFTQAPALKDYWGSASDKFNTWTSQLSLHVYDTETHKVTDVTSAGTGVQTPLFTRNGRNIIYIQGGSIQDISLTGEQTPMTLATISSGLLQVEDFVN